MGCGALYFEFNNGGLFQCAGKMSDAMSTNSECIHTVLIVMFGFKAAVALSGIYEKSQTDYSIEFIMKPAFFLHFTY